MAFNPHVLTTDTSSRDKHPCNNTSGLHELPDDILIIVFSSCDIETLLALRLTCSSFCTVLQAYINIIAPLSARVTFPNCNLLLTPPSCGYSLSWLRDLIPAQLASITLDKDKLRRHPYVNAGFPYGIPSESDGKEATFYRQRLANGWRLLRSFHLISAKVYSSNDTQSKRPNAFRQVSGGIRTSRVWQTVSCRYAGCTEHSVSQFLSSKHRRNSCPTGVKDPIAEVRRKESLVLERRLKHVASLSTGDLYDYVYLWRLLLHIFRPYCKPETAVDPQCSNAPHPRPSWPTVISDIAQGCSWLNWFILHIGTTPFLTQWFASSHHSNLARHNALRDAIWTAWSARSTHQIEIEREYVSSFEFALRKRCLTTARLLRLEAEMAQGKVINTISLDCMPCGYDMYYQIPRQPSDFPWYADDQVVWLDGEWGLQCAAGSSWSQPGGVKRSLVRWRDDGNNEKGPLQHIQHLVYLGTDVAAHLWPASEGDGAELAF